MAIRLVLHRIAASLAIGSVFAAVATGCATTVTGPSTNDWIVFQETGFSIVMTAADTTLLAAVTSWADSGRSNVMAFFGREFVRNYTVRIFPDRATLDVYWRDRWRAPTLDQGCWTIAAARADEVTMLSPAAWQRDACGHDWRDPEHSRLILSHELVHVLHGQVNPSLAQASTAMPWLVEGLAVYASGQLQREYALPVEELVQSGYAPTRLAELWAGTWRYGVAGSVVAYIDQVAGRQALRALLLATTEAQALGSIGISEGDLLAGWRVSVLAQ